MTEELFYFNGVNGDTGEYALSPMTARRLVDVLRGVAEPENLKDLKARVHWEEEVDLGTVEWVDPTKIEEAGWGVIFPADVEGIFVPAIKEALKPLLDLRQKQAGRYFRIYEGQDALRPDESKYDFLVRHHVSPSDPANPEHMPYYLLLVGDPQQIPYRFQSQLDVQYAVGRIYFATLDEYANYARSVVAAENGAQTGEVQLAREAVFFSVANADDRATEMTTSVLMQPLYGKMTQKYHDWCVSAYMGEAATKTQLAQLLNGNRPPALLFTASHGMDFIMDSERQLLHQGALLCQEWPGRQAWQKPIPHDFYFAGEDLTSEANLLGTIAFFFACFGGGTPQYDEFSQPGTKTPKQLASHPFVANLPMRMLGQSRGGALATIAHVDRTWSSSFQLGRDLIQTDVFESVLSHLMAGKPVGSAMEHFNSRYATWATEINTIVKDMEFSPDLKFEGRFEPASLSSMWTSHNDARGYAIIGDPAVRLPLRQDSGSDTIRAEFDEAIKINSTTTATTAPTLAPLPNNTSPELPINVPEGFAVRVEFPDAPEGEESFALTDTLEERSQSAIQSAMHTIQAMALQTDLMCKGIPGDSQPHKIKIKFGINLDFKAGALIARSGVGATMEVELAWARRADDVLRAETDVESVDP